MRLALRIVYLLLVLTSSVHSALAADISGNPIGCRGDNSQLKFYLMRGRLLLHSRFLPQDSRAHDEMIKASVELQLKHLMSFFRTTTHDMNASLSSFRDDIKILRSERVPYGSSFTLDSYLPASRGLPQNAYLKRALERGSVNKEDQAQLVHYETKVLIADCSETSFLSQKVILPLDPYLSLWMDAASSRKPRTLGAESLAQVSQCSANDIVHFGTADSGWYFWSPRSPKHGPCVMDPARIYHPEFLHPQELRKISTFDPTFFKSRNFRMTAIFGLVSASKNFRPIDYEALRSSIRENLRSCKNASLIPRCLSSWSGLLSAHEGKYYEPGLYNFLGFLKLLNTIAEIETFELGRDRQTQSEIMVNLRVKLRHSQAPIEIETYFGRTSLDHGNVTANYAKLLVESFRNADIVSYLGHAGLGKNLNMESILELGEQHHIGKVERIKPLWLGIYNCEAFTYFGFDLDMIFKKGEQDLLITQTSGKEVGPEYVLSQLFILDRTLDAKELPAPKVETVFGNYVNTKDFLTVLRITEQNQ